MHTDYLIVGSGVAGLSLGIQLGKRLPKSKITIVTKSDVKNSNTFMAQGGIAVVSDSHIDSYSLHISDTLKAGDGLSHPKVVDMVVRQAPERLKELISWGAQFDLNVDCGLNLGREGGHSTNRIVHKGDFTGREIIEVLLRQLSTLNNVKIMQHCIGTDLLMHPSLQVCEGLTVLHLKSKKVQNIFANKTILATGGIGKVYRRTSNPEIATGDGIAMAYRMRANVSNMEFVQFHPTSLFVTEGNAQPFLISEALRGFGANIINKEGERFLFDVDSRGELATRDIVAKCIWNELRASKEAYVYLDCRHLDQSELKLKFPQVVNHCHSMQLDLSIDLIPVTPSAHYVCGGIDVDSVGETNIPNLLACGECSNTGLHGANRLASNSLIEALVYAFNIAQHLSNCPNMNSPFSLNRKLPMVSQIDENWVSLKKTALQKMMYEKAFILKKSNELLDALEFVIKLKQSINIKQMEVGISSSFVELKNMSTIAYLILKQSINRSVNVGTFAKN